MSMVTDSGRPGEQVLRRRHGRCHLCGFSGTFELRCRSTREGFNCPNCRSSLRYQHQAQVIVDIYGDASATDLTTLAQTRRFRELAIYEPGVVGPFRKLLQSISGYTNSYFWNTVQPGEFHDGVRCEDLEQLTFPDATFDLVISSDIFEHIRDPWSAFRSIFRVLVPGGRHIMSIPTHYPLPAISEARVDTSGPEDVFIKPPVYHGSPKDPQGSLVYTDFGADLPEILTEMGYDVSVHYGPERANTYVMRRPFFTSRSSSETYC